MSEEGTKQPVVLVVEDEPDLTELYAAWLSGTYEVRVALTGEEAVEQMDKAVDVILLDRNIPDMSGDDFLEHVRSKGYDCQVAMVSAVDPDFDIVEMGFDDYVVKPVNREALTGVVERLLSLDTASEASQDYFAMVAKKRALEGEKSREELARSEQYASLVQSIESYSKRVVSLAEEYLESRRRGGTTEFDRIYREAIDEWRSRQAELDEDDPLYQVARAEIQRYERLLEQSSGAQNDAERDLLLEAVADGFIPEGFWLNPRIRKALNVCFFDKHNDFLVIEGKRLEPGNRLTPEQFFAVAKRVRALAAAELA